MGVSNSYDYEFSVWPAERRWESPIYDVFRCFPRIILELTETQFQGLRDALERSGLTLRETTRVPHQEPEVVRGWGVER